MVKEKLSKKFFRFLASSNISVPSMLYYFFPAFEKQAISTHMNLVLGFYIPCSQGCSLLLLYPSEMHSSLAGKVSIQIVCIIRIIHLPFV
ncbi:hypothetical protein D5086_030017 [Populus alba]|uniref:Uncharacterized protein n=1 Tax=Populus alba TaxID=43335 RepID=A0ACC4AN40_POPAL